MRVSGRRGPASECQAGLTAINAPAGAAVENPGQIKPPLKESRMPLSEQQVGELLAGMRERLAVLEEEIFRKLEDGEGGLAVLDGVGDAGDLSQAIANSEIDFSEALRDIEEWRSLRGAIRRIDEGSYGLCIDCGTGIPFARLQAQPVAARCIACQTQVEHAGGV